MWQVLLAAAVAGSGFLANRFLNPNSDPTISSEESETRCGQYKDHQQSPKTDSVDGSVFRFSSSGSGAGSGSRFGSNNGRKKKSGSVYGQNAEGFRFKNVGIGKSENKSGGLEPSKSGRKFAVCVKKRRTSKNSPGKCESRSSKDNSVFSWGVGVGLMCMMSAGKAEIGRLNTTMDETAKVVQELKVELHKRKSSRGLQFPSSKSEANANPDKISGRNTQLVPQPSTETRGNAQNFCSIVTEESGCASSVLTEEPRQEVLELDRLEAELESELQKLPWCSTGAPGLEERMSNICENDASADGFCKPDGLDPNSYQSSGVLPSELDQKLCHLLIEQQESQIVDLESELHHAQSKLHEKEAELQALKDCVRRLTEFSLATVSDDETETRVEEMKMKDEDYDKKMVTESQRSKVGMKRAMDFEPYSCHTK